MIPVPRKLWAQISAGSPVFRARHLIILSAFTRDIPLSEVEVPESGAPGELAEGRGCKSPGTKE